MARPHVTPPEPIDLTDQRIQIGDTTAFVTKLNTTQDAFERFSSETDAYTGQLNALGDYLEQRADSADADAAATAADRQAVADDKAAVATDRQAVADHKATVATDRAAVETAANQVATDQHTVAADKAVVTADRAAVEAAASQVTNDASAAAESASSASSSAQTAAQLRDQTQALRDQAEAIAFDDDIESSVMQLINDSWDYWRENERDDDVAVQNGRYKFTRLTSGDDAGDAWAHGFYGVFSTSEARQMKGLPVGTSGVLMSINPTEVKTGCHQIYFSNNDREVYYRSLFSGDEWRKVFSDDYQEIESEILNQGGVYYSSSGPNINIDDKSIGGAVGLWYVENSGSSAPWFLPNSLGFFETRRLFNSVAERFFQTVKSFNTRNHPPEFGYRVKGEDGWTPWARSLNSLNVLSPVQQPDADNNVKGGVIERGENAKGEYVKFADGTMICWGMVGKDLSSNNMESFAYPVYFSSSNVSVTLSLNAASRRYQVRNIAFFVGVAGISSTTFKLENYEKISGEIRVFFNYCAIGRWY